MEAFMGTVTLIGGNFAPRAWLPCDGRLLPIAEYDALFALLGTTYGGDGVSTFGLPDLQGRAAIGAGQGRGLPNVVLGQKAGVNSETVTTGQLGAHTHPATFNAQALDGTDSVPAATLILGQTFEPTNKSIINGFATPQNPNISMSPAGVTLGTAGGSLPLDIRQPFLGMMYIICVEGIFPSQG